MAIDRAVMTREDEQQLLTSLAESDWMAVREAVDRAGDLLRAGPIEEPLRSAIAEHLLRLSRHTKWEVRKAVAHALLYLRHDCFHEAIARIVDDENSWVREAARKTFQRRTDLTRSEIQGTSRDEAILSALANLEMRYGVRASRSAMKIAVQLHRQFVQEAYHEMVHFISPLDTALLNLRNEIADGGVVALGRESALEKSRGRLGLLIDVLANLREYTTEVPREFTTESIEPLLREAGELAASNAAALPQETQIRYEVPTAITVDVNRSYILRAFINIMVNSVEACRRIGRPANLHISVRPLPGGYVQITIADNGNGMSEEVLADCMKLYSSAKGRGSGFGLPIAKRIIEVAHQGKLSISSQKGAGTTVTIMVPVEQQKAED